MQHHGASTLGTLSLARLGLTASAPGRRSCETTWRGLVGVPVAIPRFGVAGLLGLAGHSFKRYPPIPPDPDRERWLNMHSSCKQISALLSMLFSFPSCGSWKPSTRRSQSLVRHMLGRAEWNVQPAVWRTAATSDSASHAWGRQRMREAGMTSVIVGWSAHARYMAFLPYLPQPRFRTQLKFCSASGLILAHSSSSG